METNNENLGWPITAERFVGFIDIMGFKDWINREDNHEEILRKLRQQVHLKNVQKIFATLLKTEEHVKFFTFSDSTIFITKDRSEDSVNQILDLLQKYIGLYFSNGIPFKGALSFGKMTADLDNNIFFGKPLIDAYTLHEELKMYGIVIDAYAQKELDSISAYSKFILEYENVPFEKSNSRHYLIKPVTEGFQFSISVHDFKSWYQSCMKEFRYSTSGHLRRYIDNTEKFLDYCSLTGGTDSK